MSGGPQAYDMKALALGAAYQSPYDSTDAPMIMLHDADDFIVNVTTNVEKNRAGYARSGVAFEAHVFANTSRCEKDVESDSSVVRFSILFVGKHTGMTLKDSVSLSMDQANQCIVGRMDEWHSGIHSSIHNLITITTPHANHTTHTALATHSPPRTRIRLGLDPFSMTQL